MKWSKKDLLGIRELSKDEILFILNTSDSFKEISKRDIKKVPTLRGKTVITLFYEPSTRTRTSFEIAAKRLSADTINISSSTSSYVKGETLKDTAKNLESMRPDAIIIRHNMPGAPHMLAGIMGSSVINGGGYRPQQGSTVQYTGAEAFRYRDCLLRPSNNDPSLYRSPGRQKGI
jgi:aspartate carbamoyltransferase catalytic subunit